jgi:internalin A
MAPERSSGKKAPRRKSFPLAPRTAADAAYKAAQAEIARVAEGGTALDFSAEAFHALTTLPPEIADLQQLKYLSLSKTQVADPSPTTGLTNLLWLNLDNTQVADLSPIAQFTNLQSLNLNNAQVADLSPIAQLTNLQLLALNNTQVADLSPILFPIAQPSNLHALYLDNTQVADLAPPLAQLSNLQALHLANTQVADLAPLAQLPNLQTLYLTGTQAADLRPILNFLSLGDGPIGGLWFQGCAATRHDPRLDELSKIEDSDERLTQTPAYLRTLPPWPEPLPWMPPGKRDAQARPDPPDPDPGLPLKTTLDGLIDLDVDPHGPNDDPLVTKSFARLQQAVTALVRHGNQYPELRDIADSLLAQTTGPLAEASLYDIHLDVGALFDLLDGNPNRAMAEQLDADAIVAIQRVTRLGPPLTMNDDLVIAYEEAHARFARQTRSDTVRAGERAVVEAVSKDKDVIGERLRGIAAKAVALPGDEGRTDTTRTLIAKNLVIKVGLVVGATAATSLVGLITVESAKAAWAAAPGYWSFLVTNKDAIMAAAAGWGDQAHVWTADLMARAVEISQARNRRLK